MEFSSTISNGLSPRTRISIQAAETIFPQDTLSPLFLSAIPELVYAVLPFLDFKEAVNLRCCRFLYHAYSIEVWIKEVPEEKIMTCIKTAFKGPEVDSPTYKVEKLIKLSLCRDDPFSVDNLFTLWGFVLCNLSDDWRWAGHEIHLTELQAELLGHLTICLRKLQKNFGSKAFIFLQSLESDLPFSRQRGALLSCLLGNIYQHWFSYPILISAAKTKNHEVMQHFFKPISTNEITQLISEFLNEIKQFDAETLDLFLKYLFEKLSTLKLSPFDQKYLASTLLKTLNTKTIPYILKIFQIIEYDLTSNELLEFRFDKGFLHTQLTWRDFNPFNTLVPHHEHQNLFIESSTQRIFWRDETRNKKEKKDRCIFIAFIIFLTTVALFLAYWLPLSISIPFYLCIRVKAYLDIKPSENSTLKDKISTLAYVLLVHVIEVGAAFRTLISFAAPRLGNKIVFVLTHAYPSLFKEKQKLTPYMVDFVEMNPFVFVPQPSSPYHRFKILERK
jgi:hypothetical protein